MIRNLLMIAALMFAPISAIAQEAANPCADIAEATRGKTNEQVQTILRLCRNESEPSGPSFTAEDASRWAEASKGFSEAIGNLARELGMATNEFLTTPAGILIASILVLYFGGQMFVALPFSVFSAFALYRVYIYTMYVKTYTTVPILFGLWNVRKLTSSKAIDTLTDAQQVKLFVFTIFTIILNVGVWIAMS